MSGELVKCWSCGKRVGDFSARLELVEVETGTVRTAHAGRRPCLKNAARLAASALNEGKTFEMRRVHGGDCRDGATAGMGCRAGCFAVLEEVAKAEERSGRGGGG